MGLIFFKKAKKPVVAEDWTFEIDRILEKNFRIGSILAVAFNTLFGVVIYFQDHVRDLNEFSFRLFASALIGSVCLLRSKIPLKIKHLAALPVFILIVQDAYILSTLPEDELIGYTLAHSANFIGAAMLLIWPIRFSAPFWTIITVIHVLFFAMFSDVPVQGILENGGWLLFGVLMMTVVFINLRYIGLRNMIRVRMELERNNEWMQVQNGIIESKSAELQKSNQRLKEFAYIVSHDLKAPLRGINNIIGWLQEDCGSQLNAEGRSHIDLLKKQVIKMEQMICNVLEYSKAEASRNGAEWIDMDELVNELIESVGTDGKTVFCLKIGVARIHSTRIVVRQVLQNLVTNSIKHNDKATGRVEVEVKDMGEMLCFSVTDNGPGIDPSRSESIFEMFTTSGSDDGYTNTGIGLPVAKKLVEESGGRIWHEPAAVEGTRFTFTLPRMT